MANCDKITPAEKAEKPASQAKTSSDDALESFLSRESAPKTQKNPAPKNNRRTVAVIAGFAAAVALLVGIIIFLNRNPKPVESEDLFKEAWTIATVDEAGMHAVEVPTDAEGEPRQNGSGTLLDYAPSLIQDIRVENSSGSYTLHAYTREGEATVYQLEGFESFPLQTGAPDTVANDAGDLHFLTIASAGGKLADFGLTSERARVRVTYTDGTSAVIRIGDEAPAQAGTYVSFGDAENVYLVSSESVDSFFTPVTDFISKTVTAGADSADNASFSRLTLSGSHYPQEIILEPNTDEAFSYQYRMTSPVAGFADAIISADIAGSVRDLYAEEVVAVNTSGSSAEDFLAPFGLGSDCYAEVFAEYPDASYRLRASAPDGEGYVCLVNIGDPSTGGRIVYKIQVGALGWASASLSKLAPDTVLRVSRTAITNITLTAGDKAETCSIDVDTRTQTVETTDGGTEEITTTEAYYNDKLLGDESFTILQQNLAEMKNSGKTDSPADTMLLEIRYTYSTGRDPDTVTLYRSEGKTCPVALNGVVIGSVNKTYAEALVENMNDIIDGKVPKSL